MIGIADVASHRQTHEFSAEMILQSGTSYLFSIVEILRTDESYHRVDEQRIIPSCHSIAAGFACLLIYAEVGIGRKR